MGRIVSEGREYLCIAPWAIALDWAVISLTILVLNLLGAALREGSRALRRDLAARQPAFTLRQFHDRLLGYGSIPVSLIGRAMLDALTREGDVEPQRS